MESQERLTCEQLLEHPYFEKRYGDVYNTKSEEEKRVEREKIEERKRKRREIEEKKREKADSKREVSKWNCHLQI